MRPDNRKAFHTRMDRLQVEQLARMSGLPQSIAARIAELVTATGLPDERREEVYDELVAHFEDGLATGKSAEQLLQSFGDAAPAAARIAEAKRVVTPESLGGTGRDRWFRHLGRDTRYAIRRLRSRPAFTAIAVLSLAVGIGANSAMFTLVNDVILRKPALAHPEQLIEVYRSDGESRFDVLSEPDVTDFRHGVSSVSGFATSKFSFASLERDGQTQKLTMELTSADYFQTLGLRPMRGRFYEPADAPAPGQGAVVVVSERLWRKSFNADPSLVGQSLKLNGASYDVVGILPSDYPGRLRGAPTDLYMPVTMVDHIERSAKSQLTDRGTQGTFVVGRLKPGVTLRQAQVDFDNVARELKTQKLTGWQSSVTMNLLPKSDVIIYPPIDQVLVPIAGMLMLVVGLVLLVACANLAGFLMARAVDRRKEIAVRLALGATRGQLVTQLLVETVLLAMLGGLLGILLGRLALRAVLSANFPLPMAIDLALDVDWRVLSFCVAVSVGAGILFGLMPAMQTTKLELASVIRDEATGGGRSRKTFRQLLLGAQVAVCMILLVVAGLFVRSLDAARQVDPGFGAKPAAYEWIGTPATASVQETAQIIRRLTQRLASIPGVDAVGSASNPHLNTLSNQSVAITVAGIEPPPGRTTHAVDAAEVDTGFMAAVGLTIKAGRGIRLTDGDSLARGVVVNEAFAQKFFPGRDAVGQQFRYADRTIDVVGVVNTAKIRTLSEAPRPFVYLPLTTKSNDGAIWIVARTKGSATNLVSEMTRATGDVDARLFVVQAGTVASFIATQAYPLKMGALALMGFAMVAMAMACIGLYGAVSYAVAQRNREVGIRLSLGAEPSAVVWLLLWEGLRLVLTGMMAGLVGAVVVGKLLESLLFGVKGVDPLTLGAVSLLLMALAALAAFLPARRAGRISPVVALKYE